MPQCTSCTFHSFDLQIMCVQSIFHVSHLRGLFPSQLFKTVDMPNLGGEDSDVVLNPNMLHRCCGAGLMNAICLLLQDCRS